jgi:hypothetical protein
LRNLGEAASVATTIDSVISVAGAKVSTHAVPVPALAPLASTSVDVTWALPSTIGEGELAFSIGTAKYSRKVVLE